MPRKAKEKIDENKTINEKKSVAKKTSSRKSSLAKIIEDAAKSEEKASAAKKKTSSKTTVKTTKATKVAKKSVEPVKASKTTKSSKKATEPVKTSKTTKVSKKVTEPVKTSKTTKSSKKVTEPVKASKTTKASKKSTESAKKVSKTTKKSTTTRPKKSKKTVDSSIQVAEYYDLPYKYGNTVVKLLAQTPNTLFVYWEVSENDIDSFKKLYGNDFFSKTKPILIVHNLTLDKTYEVEINDFANCWYLNTEDSNCKFDIELGRKFYDNSSEDNSDVDYLYIATSNNLQSPNDHILFEKIKEFVVFRNISTDNVIKKNVKSFKFLRDIYKFYKDMYDEDVFNNPSSQFKF